MNSPRKKPILLIRKGGLRVENINDSLTVVVTITSADAASYLTDVKYTLEFISKDGKSIRSIRPESLSGISLPLEERFQFSIGQYFPNFKRVNVILHGYYSDIDQKEIFPITEVYVADIDEVDASIVSGEIKQTILRRNKIQ